MYPIYKEPAITAARKIIINARRNYRSIDKIMVNDTEFAEIVNTVAGKYPELAEKLIKSGWVEVDKVRVENSNNLRDKGTIPQES